MAYGNPARVQGVNVVGMQRRGIAEHVIEELAAAYAADPSGESVEFPEALRQPFDWYRTQVSR